MPARIGDIVGYAPHGWGWATSPISWLIKQATSCEVTHTAIVIDPARMYVVEAWWPRARYRHVEPEPFAEWRIYRVKEADDSTALKAAKVAESLVGTKYDLRSLVSFLKWFTVERIAGAAIRDRVSIRDSEGKLFCQELITYAYEKAGFSFAKLLGFKDKSAITPRDVARRVDLFERIE